MELCASVTNIGQVPTFTVLSHHVSTAAAWLCRRYVAICSTQQGVLRLFYWRAEAKGGALVSDQPSPHQPTVTFTQQSQSPNSHSLGPVGADGIPKT